MKKDTKISKGQKRYRMMHKTSRNKDIDLLHEVTKKPYKICRKQLKTHKWNLTETWIHWIIKENEE